MLTRKMKRRAFMKKTHNLRNGEPGGTLGSCSRDGGLTSTKHEPCVSDIVQYQYVLEDEGSLEQNKKSMSSANCGRDLDTNSTLTVSGFVSFPDKIRDVSQDHTDDEDEPSRKRKRYSRKRITNQVNRQAGLPYEGSSKGEDGKRITVIKEGKKAGPMCSYLAHPPYFGCKAFAGTDLNVILSEIVTKHPTRAKQIEFVQSSVITEIGKHENEVRQYFLEHPETKEAHRVCTVLFASCVGQCVRTIRRWSVAKCVARINCKPVNATLDGSTKYDLKNPSLKEFFNNLPKIEADYAKRRKDQKKKFETLMETKSHLYKVYIEYCQKHGYTHCGRTKFGEEMEKRCIRVHKTNSREMNHSPCMDQAKTTHIDPADIEVYISTEDCTGDGATNVTPNIEDEKSVLGKTCDAGEDHNGDLGDSSRKRNRESRRKVINRINRQAGRPYEGSSKREDGKRITVIKEGKKAGPMCSYLSHPPNFECKEFAGANLDMILSGIRTKYPTRAKQIEFVQSSIITDIGRQESELRKYFLEHPETKEAHRVCTVLFASCVGQSVRTIRRWCSAECVAPTKPVNVTLEESTRYDAKNPSLKEFFNNLPKIEADYAKKAHKERKDRKKKLDYWIKSKSLLHKTYIEFCNKHGYIHCGRTKFVEEMEKRNVHLNNF